MDITFSISALSKGDNKYLPEQLLPDKDELICCLYSYYEKNEQYKNNLQHFIENGGILNSVEYYIIINGECSIDFARIKNNPKIHIIYRENKGFDFGAYSDVIHNHIKKEYKYYFFLNTSVIGPCFRSENSASHIKWTDSFIELFTDESVKIVGTSINTYSPNMNVHKYLISLYGKKNVYSHVQSMFFCIKSDYLQFLQKLDFFKTEDICNMNMNEIILKKEIGLSQIALNAGWNINCILSKYKGLDYRQINHNINPSTLDGDPYNPNKYFYGNIDKYEVIFFKNNRNITA